MRFLYTTLFYLLLPFIFLRLLWRSRRLPDYRKHWKERLGYSSFQLPQCIWIHAVSVGETIAAIPFIKALQTSHPDMPIVVTNMTPTGAARVKAALGDSVLQAFVPYDVPSFLIRFVDAIKPRLLVVMETELWPNLFACCYKKNIPVMVANARLSQKSAKGYAYIPSLNREMFKAIHRLAAQSDADAERFQQLGLPRDKIIVTGNMKFDLEVADDLAIKSQALHDHLGHDRWIWIAASTHAGEEQIILDAHRTILANYPEVLLILVPRHPDRFNEVYALIQQQGFSVERRSAQMTEVCTAQVYLGDTMGELMLMYSVANIALVAGSFAQVGGHNMLEPAILHKPILSGPHIFNFADISRMLLAEKAMTIVQDANTLAHEINVLWADENRRHRMGESAYNVVAKNRGALQRQVDIASSLLSESRP